LEQELQLLPLLMPFFVQIIPPSGDFHRKKKPMEEQYCRAWASPLRIGAGFGFGFAFGFAFGWQ
jgi:hypothetical protein